MRVIAKSSLRKFWEQPNNGDAKGQLEAWHDFALKASWQSPQDIKNDFKLTAMRWSNINHCSL